MATISTHNGSKLSQGHNRRDKKIVSKEEHIDENGTHEEWLDIDVKVAYKRIFEKARVEYNATQKRKDRIIDDYLDKIRQDKKKHICYEMIVGVYGEDSTPQQKKEILWEFANNWKERNPNLVMIGCYFHDDERDPDTGRKTGMHIHIDYIPIATCERGMKLQNALDRGLGQQGIEPGESIHETRQILWEKRENAYLEQLCNQKGIAVQHEEFSRKHLDTSAYKRRMISKENRELQQENLKLMETNKKQHEVNTKNNKALHRQVEQYKALQEELQHMQESLQKGQKELEKMKDEYIDEVHTYASKEAKEHFKRGLEW